MRLKAAPDPGTAVMLSCRNLPSTRLRCATAAGRSIAFAPGPGHIHSLTDHVPLICRNSVGTAPPSGCVASAANSGAASGKRERRQPAIRGRRDEATIFMVLLQCIDPIPQVSYD